MNFKEQLQKEKNPWLAKMGEYLLEYAKENGAFIDRLNLESKSLQKSFEYILGELQADGKIYRDGSFGCIQGEDNDLYAMAIHYYDEDEIEIKPFDGYMVNQKRVPTSTPKESNEEVAESEMKKRKTRKKVVNKDKDIEGQLSLF